MSYSPPPLNASTAVDLLNRVVVRTGEYALTLDGELFDISEMAENVFFKSIDFELHDLNSDQFKAACQNYPKTHLKYIDHRVKDDGFLQPQFSAPLLGIVDDSGQLRVIDGFKRAHIIFGKHPDAVVTVVAVKAADAEQFRRDYEKGRAFKLMREENPLWVAASDEDVSGGDLVAFTTDTRRGTPANEGDGGLLGNLVAIRGLEIIRRRFANEKSVHIAYRENYDEILAGLMATISGRKYSAAHEARNGIASGERLEANREVARTDGGKFATWQRNSRQRTKLNTASKNGSISEKIREYYVDMGIPHIADAQLDLSNKSDDILVKEFVLLSRASAAHLQTRSAEKYSNRVNSGREGKNVPYDKFENNTIGNKLTQQQTWLDLPALFEASAISGLNLVKFYHNMDFTYDLMQWASQIFFIRQGHFRPLATWGEAHQYLYWTIIHASITSDQEKNNYEISPMLHYWVRIFNAFDGLPSPIQSLPDHTARGAVASVCWGLFQQRSCEFFEFRRNKLVRGLRNLGFFHP